MNEPVSLSLLVNGKVRHLTVDRRATLLDVLRDELGLTGAKYGCGTGDCGTCKVLIDGEAVNACLVRAVKAEGKEIVTIEGLSAGGLTPIQEAFVKAGAVQCGFCIPGMVITATALLRRNPNPSRREIAESLDENLCRCTGYVKILDAIEMARDQMLRGE
jgi:aerobic carbon-monoxide dehydrogenase small subunit